MVYICLSPWIAYIKKFTVYSLDTSASKECPNAWTQCKVIAEVHYPPVIHQSFSNLRLWKSACPPLRCQEDTQTQKHKTNSPCVHTNRAAGNESNMMLPRCEWINYKWSCFVMKAAAHIAQMLCFFNDLIREPRWKTGAENFDTGMSEEFCQETAPWLKILC